MSVQLMTRSGAAVLFCMLGAGSLRAEGYSVRLAPKRIEIVGEKVADRGAMHLSLLKARPRLQNLHLQASKRPLDTGGSAGTTNPLYTLIQQSDAGDKGYTFTLGSGPQMLAQGALPDIEVADSKASSLFPGAMVQGQTKDIQAGQLVENPLPRSGGTVTIDGIQFKSGSQSQTVPVANHATISQAIANLLRQPYSPDQAGTSSCSFNQVYSSSEAAYDVDASVSYLSVASVSNTFQQTNNTTETHILVYCRQEYFTVSFDAPSNENSVGYEAFFDKNLDIDTAKRFIGPGRPPLLVQNVTYGSELYIVANSRNSASDMIDTLKVAVSYAGVSGSGSFTDHQKSVLNSMSVSTLARGGRASAQEFVTGTFAPDQVASALVGYIKNTIDVSASANGPQEVGVPLAYNLIYLDYEPVGEIETVVGMKYTASPLMLQNAKVHFHQNGDGKDWDTEVDLMLKDGGGTIVAQNHLGKHTDFGDNTMTQDYPINPVKPISKDELLASGSFDMVIQPVGHDHWNYTAYLTLGWDDGTNSTGNIQNWVDQDSTGRSQKFSNNFISR